MQKKKQSQRKVTQGTTGTLKVTSTGENVKNRLQEIKDKRLAEYKKLLNDTTKGVHGNASEGSKDTAYKTSVAREVKQGNERDIKRYKKEYKDAEMILKAWEGRNISPVQIEAQKAKMQKAKEALSGLGATV